MTKDGKVYAYGENSNGQCGTGTKVNCVVPTIVKDTTGIGELSNIVDVSARGEHSAAVDKDGNLYTWGSNNHYCIGKESNGDQLLPRKNTYINDIIYVSSGPKTVTVAKKDGTVWAFGDNEKGQLGNGLFECTYKPVQVGEDEVYVETNHVQVPEFSTFDLKGGIKNFNLIKDVQTGGVSYETKDTGIANVDSTGIVTGVTEGSTEIIVKANGSNKKAIVQVDTLRKQTEIKPKVLTAGSHQVILRADGSVWTYGDNKYGELGDGTKVSRDDLAKVTFTGDVKIKDIASGDNHVLALDVDGNVWAWGRNNYNQLGIDIGESLSPTKLDLGEKIVKIAAGYNQSFAITEENKLIAWGLNDNGQLGIGSSDFDAMPTMVQNVKGILDIDTGKAHSTLITTNGDVYTCGNNSYGALSGTISKRTRFEKAEGLENICHISSGEHHNLALDLNGKAYAWGGNASSQIRKR